MHGALLAVVALSACSSDAVDLELANASCTRSTSAITANVTMSASVEEGDTVIVIVAFSTSGQSTSETEQWMCGSWSTYSFGGGPTGCRRDPGQPATESLYMQHYETVDTELPDPFLINVAPALLGGRGTGMNLYCTD